jgi:hypothetical protein
MKKAASSLPSHPHICRVIWKAINECTEEPQHMPDDTESPEQPANFIDEEDEEIPLPHMQPERGQSRKCMANRKHRCRIGMKTKHSSSKQSCILCFARINCSLGITEDVSSSELFFLILTLKFWKLLLTNM